MSYRVLKPVYVKTTDKYRGHDFPEHGYFFNVSEWSELGVAASMEEANAKFPRGRKNGYSLVLEEIAGIH